MTSVLETTCCIAAGGPAGLDEFLALPHYKAYHVYGQFGTRRLRVADFTRLPTRCGFIAFMPQWDFLDFLARQGERYGAFELRMKTEVTGLLEEDGRVCGVRAGSPEGELEIRADLVIGADGRASAVRAHSAHWQFGYVIPKGTLAALRARGIEAFRASVAELARFAGDRVQEIASWDDVKLLSVAVERLR